MVNLGPARQFREHLRDHLLITQKLRNQATANEHTVWVYLSDQSPISVAPDNQPINSQRGAGSWRRLPRKSLSDLERFRRLDHHNNPS
jgi:hypothetical protein